ncbi:hypothetical protein FQZ97_770610 [compost metagenome]
MRRVATQFAGLHQGDPEVAVGVDRGAVGRRALGARVEQRTAWTHRARDGVVVNRAHFVAEAVGVVQGAAVGAEAGGVRECDAVEELRGAAVSLQPVVRTIAVVAAHHQGARDEAALAVGSAVVQAH